MTTSCYVFTTLEIYNSTSIIHINKDPNNYKPSGYENKEKVINLICSNNITFQYDVTRFFFFCSPTVHVNIILCV